ncbi:MAG: hypothetical protein E6G64_15740 [Actinobacteria bacterium]|nr:MAG: hypothetical protein E6G64_15740 [Actinomycetota bacterium]
MAMMVVLLEATDGEFSVRPDQISQLARLGVSNLALVRDPHTVGIVLEGWLFDPARSGAEAVRSIANGGRALHPVLHMAVTTAVPEGGRDVRDIPHART